MSAYQYIIIGGGISGLYAAYLLEQRGITDYLLLEAKSSLGGRLNSAFATDSSGINAAFDLGATWFWEDQQPELAPRMEQLIENFQFELNYNLWVRKREDVVKNGNTVQLERWDKNNSDMAPTEDWQAAVDEIYNQMAQIASQDPIIKDLSEQKRKIKAVKFQKQN